MGLAPRVVITGLGTINCIGNSIDAFWQGLVEGKSGIGPITLFDASDLPCRIAGEINGFDPEQYLDRKTVRRLPRSVLLANAAAHQAVEDAGLPLSMPEPERAGVVVGTGVAGIESIIYANDTLKEHGYKRLNPFMVPSGIPNIPAFQIAKQFQCLGPNTTTATACAAGTQAVGQGAEMIKRGKADIVIAGGSEAIVLDLVIATFSIMKALPTSFNSEPERASRPFDALREGFVLSEGSAMLVLEELEHALERGARIYAEVLGYASSSDGYHLAALKPDGLGPARVMRWAMEDAGINLHDVDYINAHGTSTLINDPTETLAIKKVFNEKAYEIPISSTKSMIGHAMGAAGALEAVACALTIKNDIIPATINYENSDPDCDLNYVPNQPISKEVKTLISNSFGLGGQNACLVMGKFRQQHQ